MDWKRPNLVENWPEDEKITNNLIQINRSPVGDLNSGPTEHEAGILPPTIATLNVLTR